MVHQTKELKWQRMADDFRKEILSGTYQPGRRLPSDETIAKNYGINKRTVAAGMAQLVAEGLVNRAPGRGSIVVRQEIVKRHTDTVVCVTYSSGDIYQNMELEIAEQALKCGFYPIWIPPSFFRQGIISPGYKPLYQYLDHTINSMPHGMIVYGERFIPYELLERNLAKIGNLVFICNYVHTKELPAKYVLIDYEAAARKAIALLQRNGHNTMTFLTSPIKNIKKYQRKPPQYHYHLALKKTAAEMGMNYDEEIPELSWKGTSSIDVMNLIRSRNISAAVLAFDSVIEGYYKEAVDELKIRIPEDLSVIGFYNTGKKITTFDIKERLIAAKATEMLFDNSRKNEKMYVVPELIDRNSVLKRQ